MCSYTINRNQIRDNGEPYYVSKLVLKIIVPVRDLIICIPDSSLIVCSLRFQGDKT
jgi:hypothetical protein